MHRFLPGLIVVLFSWFTIEAVQSRQPNFIIIFCDDLGYADIGPFGSTQHRTPNIDRMAQEGMRLTNFYSTCGVCTPSRSSLMTGCYPQRVGLHENEKGQWVLFPGNQRGLHPQETTIAEMLKDAGYATAIVGKWHLGDQPEFLPTRHGFDSYFGIPFSNDMGKLDRPVTMYPPTPLLRNETVIELEPNQRFLTKRYTQEAKAFISENKDRPFFLYLPHSMPHWPQYATKRFAEKSANGPWGDAVEEIDWSTGQILDHLKELGIDEETFVIFTSDNGGALHHGANNAPLRGGKGTTWEGGHRVCCVVRWPGKIPAGSKNDALAVTFDLLPTLAHLASGKISANRIDGKDITQLLMGKSDRTPHERFFYYFRGELNAVRRGNWKLFVKRRPRRNQPAILAKPELYDLANDVGEQNNVAAQHPDVVQQLMVFIEACRSDLGDGKDAVGENVRPAGFVERAEPLTANPPKQLQTSTVFVAGEEGYHTFRIPALLTLPNGKLLAFCEGRKSGRADHGDIDLVMKSSNDFGQTWGNLQLVFEEGGEAKTTIGNPCPVVDETTGVIWMPFCRNNKDVFVTFSNDSGISWAKPKDITKDVKLKDWGWYATGPGVGIQLNRGKYRNRLVIPCDHREQTDGKRTTYSHVIYSDDHGSTWQLGESVAKHTNECQVVELHDGRLMINMRNVWGRDSDKSQLGKMRAIAISENGGASWNELRFEASLIEPICQASFVKHSHDTFRKPPLLFTNPASKTKRHKLTVRLSEDDGRSWSADRILHEGPSAYSCLTVLTDRSVGCLFESGTEHAYENITFSRFTLPWIRTKLRNND